MKSNEQLRPKTKKKGRYHSNRRKRPQPRPFGPQKISPRFESILAQIGIPDERPFIPDPFQQKALRLLQDSDVLVSAPTGSGKTWIALEAIKDCLSAGGHAWYACPLKALSNAKCEEFSNVFGADSVGIVTGDRKENSSAPLVVGTTEILRNQLYDSMSKQIPLPFELVILDEAHYLGEMERGVVWEETLIYLPPTTRILLLSATIKNTNEIAEWLTARREVPCSVVTSNTSPVPLHPLFLYPNGKIGLMENKKELTRTVETCLHNFSQQKKRRFHSWPYGQIIYNLRKHNLLPAIFFLKSRAECDRAIRQCPDAPRSPEEQAVFEKDLNDSLDRYSFLREHLALPRMKNSRVASHHAGHLPFWKVLVEQMMIKGHLDAIFATSTVAGGVNFPARTVVLFESDRFNGKEFQSLSATDLQQMVGRAGRRGMDHVGFALVVPGPYQDTRLIHERFHAPPDPIESQLRINFSMVLNLLLSHEPEDVRILIEQSLAAFQQTKAQKARRHRSGRAPKSGQADICDVLWGDFLRHKDFLLETGFVDSSHQLTQEGHWASQLRLDHPLLVAEAIRKGSFNGAPPEILAGMIATFVVDGGRHEDLEEGLSIHSKELTKRINRMKRDFKDLNRLLKRRHFEAADIPIWPGTAAYLWAKGASWEALLRAIPIEEGQLAMLITRTSDHLHQLIGLRHSHPELAETASEAIGLIYREPIWM